MSKRGFTLVELLVTLGIMVVGVLAITQLTILFLQMNAEQKAKVTAISLANEKLEIIRNLPYTDIGTAGGIPPGNLIQTEPITRNNIDFTVTTEIVYIDDPFDGLISTTGSSGSIYNTSNSEVLYYWDFDSNTTGETPNIGSGSLSFVDTSLDTGYQGDGIAMSSGDRITTTATGNVDLSEGRIGIWYKPSLSNAGNERIVDFETTSGNFYIRRQSNEKLQFNFGGQSARSSALTWNADQWYFIEAAWEGDNYRQIWRDGVPLALKENVATIPVIDNQMNIGNRGDSSEIVEGVLDELYILNNAHKYEIWGYNYSNPYVDSSPLTTFYWSMDSTSASQTPEVGTGPITLGGDYTETNPAVNNTGIYFSNNGNPDTDHAYIPASGNIDFAESRISFWFKPRNNNNVNNNNDYLLKASGCSSGMLELIRTDDEKLEFSYGPSTNTITIESQSYSWNKNYWYLIEAAFDDAGDTLHVYINREEVAVSTGVTVDAPIGCSGLYFANENSTSSKNGDGHFDELYILNEAYPESETADLLNTDYKRAKITVAWENQRGTREVYLISDIAPPGVETTAGGGTLIFNVFDASAQPVNGATVDVYNDSLDPIIDLTLTTDLSGRLVLPGAPATSTSYEIIVSKLGYSTDYTSAATSTYTSPVRDHLSVLEGQVTEVSFSIDLTSTLDITTVSQTLPVTYQLNTDSSGESQTSPTLAQTAAHFYPVWEDYRGSTTTMTYGQKYTFAGSNQWTNDSQVSVQANQLKPRAVADSSGNVYITWYDNSSGDNDIYIQKLSTDGIPQWSYPVKVNGDSGSADQRNPDIDIFSNELYIVWEDQRNDTGDIYLQKVSSGGVIQFGSDIKINSDSGADQQQKPKITIDSGGDLYIAWIDDRGGSDDVYLDRVNSAGSNVWSFEQQVNSNSAPDISHFDFDLDSNDDAHIVWHDDRGGDNDIYFQSYASSSVALFGSDQTITVQSPSYNQLNPHIALASDNTFYIGWHDDSGGDQDVYVLNTDSSGNSLWVNEIQLHQETSGDQLISDLATYDGTKVVATWTDYSQGEANAWLGTLNYDGSESAAPFIDFILRGTKLTHQSPDKVKFEQSYATDAAGTISVTGLEWDTYEIELNEPGVTTTQAIPSLPITLNPNTTETLKLIVD
ncbi:MAG: prepilin-type N-terminal cleavage/methylation domain-containing protein [Patescibacteria group bacterium]